MLVKVDKDENGRHFTNMSELEWVSCCENSEKSILFHLFFKQDLKLLFHIKVV